MNPLDLRWQMVRDRWPLRVKNGGTDVIAPFSIVLVSSVSVTNNELVYTIRKPNAASTDFNWNQYLVTGPFAIGGSSGNEGLGTDLKEPGLVRYDTGTPAAKQVWGPKHDQYTLSQNYYGFECLGGNTTAAGNDVAVFRWVGAGLVLGKVDDTNVSLDGTCTVSVWDGAAAGDTTMNITATNRLQALNGVNGRFCGVMQAGGTPVLMWVRRTVISKTIIDDMRIKSGDTAIEAESFTGYIEEPGTAAWADKITLTSCT